MQLPAEQGIRLCRMAVIVAVSLCATPWCAWATTSSEDVVLQTPYPYVVVEQDLKEVLLELRRNLGVAAVISDKVRGVVRGGAQQDDTAGSFLRRVGAAHDLVWYLDSGTLFVFTQQESATQSFVAAHLGAQRRAAIAEEWSTKGSGVRVAVDESARSLIVTGPAEFRERIASIIAVPRAASVVRGAGTDVTVFRGASSSQRVAVPR